MHVKRNKYNVLRNFQKCALETLRKLMEPFEQIPEVNVSLIVCLTQEDGDPVFAIQRRTNHSGVLNAIYVSKYKYSYKSNLIITLKIGNIRGIHSK